jgi:putative chitinase
MILSAITTAIRATSPNADACTWANALGASMQSSGINTPKRVAMFIGQCAVESAHFTVLSEDLDYTHETALRGAWPAKFPVGFDCTPYLQHPEALADYVYGDDAALGNTQPGDGWRFRGGGLIQITGRWWFTQLATAVAMSPEDAADWVRTTEGAARSACWWWVREGCNTLADEWLVSRVTDKIDPGTESAHQRLAACNGALAALAAAGEEIAQNPQTSTPVSTKTAPEEITTDTTAELNTESLDGTLPTQLEQS